MASNFFWVYLRYFTKSWLYLFLIILITFLKKWIYSHIYVKKNDVFQKYNVKPRLVTEGEILKELNDAIFKQTKKQLHGHIKSRFGYHVVFVLERFAKKTVPPIELLYDEIYQRLYQKKVSLKALNVLDSLTTRALN